MQYRRFDDPETSEISDESEDLLELLAVDPEHRSEIAWNGITVAFGVVMTSTWKRWEVDAQALARVQREQKRRNS